MPDKTAKTATAGEVGVWMMAGGGVGWGKKPPLMGERTYNHTVALLRFFLSQRLLGT